MDDIIYLIRVVRSRDKGAWYSEKIGSIYSVKEYRDNNYWILTDNSNFGFYKEDCEILPFGTLEDSLFRV